jgi:hypothetical protein
MTDAIVASRDGRGDLAFAQWIVAVTGLTGGGYGLQVGAEGPLLMHCPIGEVPANCGVALGTLIILAGVVRTANGISEDELDTCIDAVYTDPVGTRIQRFLRSIVTYNFPTA